MKIRRVSEERDICSLLKNIGVHDGCINILANKSFTLSILIEEIATPAALIVKQEMLSIGADAAVHSDVIAHGIKNSNVLLLCRPDHLQKLIIKLEKQPFKQLRTIADQLKKFTTHSSQQEIRFQNTVLSPKKAPFIMGILNTTPDSFSDGGKYNSLNTAVAHCMDMIEHGADIIDIGGESTRPGADHVSEKEECDRVIPVIENIRKHTDIPISIDSSKPAVTKAALEAGADMINDISGLADENMISVAVQYKCPVCIMHMQGSPRTMQKNPEYKKHVVHEIYDFLENTVARAVACGISKENCIIDPGIGFGKTLEHNLMILKYIDEFAGISCPILLGTSRKSMFGMITGNDVDNRTAASLATVAATYPHVSIYRVHDVKETKDTLSVLNAIKNTL